MEKKMNSKLKSPQTVTVLRLLMTCTIINGHLWNFHDAISENRQNGKAQKSLPEKS